MGVSKNPTNSSIFSLLFSYWFFHNSSNSHPQMARCGSNKISFKVPPGNWNFQNIFESEKSENTKVMKHWQASKAPQVMQNCQKEETDFPEPVITNLTQKRSRNLQPQEGRMNWNPCPPEQKKWLESSKIFFVFWAICSVSSFLRTKAPERETFLTKWSQPNWELANRK
jgi:hypothetical protein